MRLGRDRRWVQCPGAVGGQERVAPLAGGDHGVELAQDRGGDDSLGLGRFESVVFAGGQVPVAGGIDRVGVHGAPDRAPGGQPQ
jgi:hypothetical protein